MPMNGANFGLSSDSDILASWRWVKTVSVRRACLDEGPLRPQALTLKPLYCVVLDEAFIRLPTAQ